MCPRGRPRGQGRPRGLHLCLSHFKSCIRDMDRMKEQPRALRHAPLQIKKSVCIAFLLQFILCAVFFTISFYKGLFCAQFFLLFILATVYSGVVFLT